MIELVLTGGTRWKVNLLTVHLGVVQVGRNLTGEMKAVSRCFVIYGLESCSIAKICWFMEASSLCISIDD